MTANPAQGWRISPAPGAVLKRTNAGRFSLPMEITRDGTPVTTIDYVYTGAEIEELHSQMRILLAEPPASPPDGRHYRDGELELRL